MDRHPLHWDIEGRAHSDLYDDVFFSRADGLAETTHVFLEGNRLKQRFAALPSGATFTIGELGFGSGLNMLATIELWRSAAPAGAVLHLVSFEKHLLPPDAVNRMLAPWPHLLSLATPLISAAADHETGELEMDFGHDVHLKVMIGDVADRIADMAAPADAWFLDGFSPAKNPAMWYADLMAALATNTAEDGTFATYTAAGWVRRNLEAAGFAVEKRPGFGRKREMMAGTLKKNSGSGEACA
ncbi:tRNA (5-methylaminomethyl-2-thiouridine)(34)-methyltransferase MnmD [Notoacmeibacter ruber]|uniref:5-methylaminomethyl-2-thiouridine methyltransferase n=1 Tax=Notoacmeibacter ruber TaxID=2670375 RepID=A0A3L7JBB8_9HYPH|nr:tRNA (5-methylaminomethyl-2-thiouridine)(34)-methyltransferase MnmD [Notoacmeibacter ruber]RLQ87729.1 5-methylaminomethyl-2-thiouridine methyltransferase [Notoacmeibacter ruber]